MAALGQSSARTASLRVTAQEYDALKNEAARRGYQLSHLMRHCIFGKTGGMRNSVRPESDMTMLGDIIGKLAMISGELGTNNTHIHAIAATMDDGFRDAFGLDFCLRRQEEVGEKLLHSLNLLDELVRAHQKLLSRRLPEKVGS